MSKILSISFGAIFSVTFSLFIYDQVFILGQSGVSSNRQRDPSSSSIPKTLESLGVNRKEEFKRLDFRTPFIDYSEVDKKFVLTSGFVLNSQSEILDMRKLCSKLIPIVEAIDDKQNPLDGKGKIKALEEILSLLDFLSTQEISKSNPKSLEAIAHVQELSDALRSNLEPAMDDSLHIGGILVKGAILKSDITARKQNDATNLHPTTSHPLESSFWKKNVVFKSDLYAGFDRDGFQVPVNEACTYLDEVRGYGTHARFEMECSGQKYKVKFGSGTNVGPLNARIYHALGYSVPVMDFTESSEVLYDRKLIQNFAKRKLNEIFLKLFFIPIHSFKIGDGEREKEFNPFLWIKTATLKDGRKLNSSELEAFLLRSQEFKSFEQSENYRSENEVMVEKISFGQASLQLKDKNADTVGNWDFNKFDHPSRRELRALQIVGAWLGNFDHRRNNNKLLLIKDKEKKTLRLEHEISDVDSGIGKTQIPFAAGEVNQFPWEAAFMTTSITTDGRGIPNQKVQKSTILDLHRLENILPFWKMSEEDAKWMIRKISAISEEQLTQALIASGYPASELILVREKLISRRNSLIVAFGLEKELKLSIRPVNKGLNVAVSTTVSSKLSDGTWVHARPSLFKVVNGVLEQR